uniref:Cadherin domain-containing protein n=1 Tax=Globodera rostochiensis TaxID=31243 RepID=A0A914H3P8_GLORO
MKQHFASTRCPLQLFFFSVLTGVSVFASAQIGRRNASDESLNISLYSNSVQPQPFCVLEKDRSAVYMSIPENTSKGAILGTLPIFGLTSGPKPNIRLRIVKGREYVRLNALSKQFVLRKEIDREQKEMGRFEAIVECVPLAPVPSKSGLFPLNISVFVTVIDVNDNAPQFAQGSQFNVQIPEELPKGTPIKLDFRATDSDQAGPNSHIRYRIVRSAENKSFDEVFAQSSAEDQGMPKLRSFARLDVKVIDVDDLNPIFSSQMYRSNGLRGSKLVIDPSPIRAWDADRLFDEPIFYTLSGDNSLNYSIDELTGEVKLLAEKLVPANLIVQARQANRPERNATAFLLVESLTEANGGKESSEFIFLRFPSNTAIGTKLMHLVEGKGTSETLELLEPKEQRLSSLPFYVDEKTKWLRLSKRLPSGQYEANVSIKLTSPKRPPAIRSLHIRLTVADPMINGVGSLGFKKSIYEFEMSERGRNGGESVEIGRVRAERLKGTDCRNGTSPTEGEGPVIFFDIDPTEGILRLRSPPVTDELPPEVSELVVLAENAEGSRAFARCFVRRAGGLFLMAPNAALPLGLLCFLLLLSNCTTLSLWLSKRRFATLYDQLAYRYDSMGVNEAKFHPNHNSNSSNSAETKSRSGGWMLNRSLEGDATVAITNWESKTSRMNTAGSAFECGREGDKWMKGIGGRQ